MARVSKPLQVETITIEEAEGLFAQYAKADAEIQRINAANELKIAKIREKTQDKLAELSKVQAEMFEKLQHFAVTSPEHFTTKKSLDMSHGVIGFRTGTPAVKQIKGFTVASSLVLLKDYLPEYVRTKEEANKERLLSDREKPEVAELMTKCGLRVDQDETFYVNPKKEGDDK